MLYDRKQLKKELEQCNSLDQMLLVLKSRYNLSDPVSYMKKTLLIEGLLKGIDLISPKPKQ